MIEQAFFEDEWEVHCDKCSYYEAFEASGFPDFIEKMKDSGWKSRKNSLDQWNHICPECQKKET